MNISKEMSLLPEIHVSDILLFKRCRRQWNWRSDLRMNLVPKSERAIKALWFGSGWHYAMEDFHGYKRFPTMFDAFQAYCNAFPEEKRPEEWRELLELADGMVEHYTKHFLPRHRDFETVWIDGKPQVEIKFKLPIPGLEGQAIFAGTFDGIVQDVYGRWWIKEIKTAAQANNLKLDIDFQASAYAAAAEQYYQREIEGLYYIQFVKSLPHEPRLLANGEYSQAAGQKTTHAMYRAALIERFGNVPQRYVSYLNSLLDYETPEGNKYIRIDPVRRTEAQIRNIQWQIREVAKDMLNPSLPLYPNPLPTCAHDCSFKTPCVAMEDDLDWEDILAEEYELNPDADRGESWRKKLKYPGEEAVEEDPIRAALVFD